MVHCAFSQSAIIGDLQCNRSHVAACACVHRLTMHYAHVHINCLSSVRAWFGVLKLDRNEECEIQTWQVRVFTGSSLAKMPRGKKSARSQRAQFGPVLRAGGSSAVAILVG